MATEILSVTPEIAAWLNVIGIPAVLGVLMKIKGRVPEHVDTHDTGRDLKTGEGYTPAKVSESKDDFVISIPHGAIVSVTVGGVRYRVDDYRKNPKRARLGDAQINRGSTNLGTISGDKKTLTIAEENITFEYIADTN